MSKKENLRTLDYLKHIIDALNRISEYTQGLNQKSFLDNVMIQDAVIRNIEIIGEACRNIDKHDPDFSLLYHDLPLRVAYEMRNLLAHGYFTVDLEIVWRTVKNDLPKLEKQVSAIYQELNKKI